MFFEQKERQKRDLEEPKERRKLEKEEKLAHEAEKLIKDKEQKRKVLEREEKKKLQQQRREIISTGKQSESSAAVHGLQLAELSSNECGADGELLREWVQCTNKRCAKLMHVDFLQTDGDLLICGVCESVFQ